MHREPEPHFGWQTATYIVMGLGVLIAVVIAVYGLRQSQSTCAYQRAIYPSAHRYRVEVKRFLHDHYLLQLHEAREYRESAAEEPDLVTARLDRHFAKELERHATQTLGRWRRIDIPGPPQCS